MASFKRRRWLLRLGALGRAIIQLSGNKELSETAVAGDLIGTLSVTGPDRGWEFTILDDPLSAATITGNNLLVSATPPSAGDVVSLTIQAEDDAGNIITRVFTINVYTYSMFQLRRLGGVGLFASWEHDSVAIVDPVTPANNYDGSFAGKFTLVGTPTTGPNGGMLSTTGTNRATLQVTQFPWNPAKGTIGGEFVKMNVGQTSSHFFGVDNSVGNVGNAVFRNGAIIATLRLAFAEATGGNHEIPSTRFFYDVIHRAVGTWDNTFKSATLDGQTATSTAAPTVNTSTNWFFTFGGSAGGATGPHVEILEAFYIPTTWTLAQIETESAPRFPQDFFVDSVAGSDSNNGKSEAAPRQTLTAHLALASAGTPGKVRYHDRTWLKTGSRFHEINLTFPYHSPVGQYGDPGAGYPIIDGSLPATGWTVNGTHATIFQKDVSMSVVTSQPYYATMYWGDWGQTANPEAMRAISETSLSIGTGLKTWVVGTGKAYTTGAFFVAHATSLDVDGNEIIDENNYMTGLITTYIDDEVTVNILDAIGSGTKTKWVTAMTSCIRPYFGGVTIADNLTYVAAHPGTYTAHETGSTTPHPNNSKPATSITFYINPPDGLDPDLSLVPVYYGTHANQVIVLLGGEEFNDITIQRTATKDMLTKGASNRPMFTNRIRLLDFPGHGIVCNTAHHIDGYARGYRWIVEAGGAWHYFRDSFQEGTGGPCSATRCIAERCYHAFYSHGSPGGGPPNQSVNLLDCEAREVSFAIQTGGCSDGIGSWLVENFVRVNTGRYILNCVNDDLINSP